ncbi:hypothetical protein [Stenotrophomonas sp. SMYL11]|nr:hypothetical protein [Stenotrophomonas sp. SMYL11]
MKRLSEFRYTHNMTIQNITIKGTSMFLASMGLPPLSALSGDDKNGDQ